MKLLEKTHLAHIPLQNRMAMAPMTRSRADIHGVITDLTRLYYQQRATAGLIITEGINISPQAIGSPYTPGIFTPAQIEAWKPVTHAVRSQGGRIFAQLWHTGRVGHTSVRNGSLPVAPSAIPITGQQHYTPTGPQDFETPHPLTIAEIQQIFQDYRQAAINAIEAGFDGVELHGANGYLPHQFLSDGANQRTDHYGGSIENRSRFTLEAIQAIVDAVGPDRAGIRLSPTNPYNAITSQDPEAQFTHLLQELNHLPLAYVHLMNTLFPTDHLPHYPKDVLATFGPHTRHTIIANGGYTRETGEAELHRGIAKIIAYGSLYLANPDLPTRFQQGAPLNQPDHTTFFTGAEKGYTDYPLLDAVQA
jgi:N-ethylmaleimide reductase